MLTRCYNPDSLAGAEEDNGTSLATAARRCLPVPGDGPGVLLPLYPEVRLPRLQDVHLLLQQRQVVRGRRRLQLVLPLRQRAQVVANFVQPLLKGLKNEF